MAKDGQAVAWFEKNRVGSDLEACAAKITKRLNDRGHQVRAAPYGFGQQHIGTFTLLQPADVADQVIEAAAEAGAGNFLHGKALGP